MLRGIRTRLLCLVIATVVPFTALIGTGLWTQWSADQDQALQSALGEARLLAAQVDNQLGNLQNLLAGLSPAVSTNPADAEANDAVLRKVKEELPSYVSNLLLSSVNGRNIGTSGGSAGGRSYVGDRDFFRSILSGERLAIGEPIHGRSTGKWVTTIARPVTDESGELRAVLSAGILLERFQDALNTHALPAGSVVQIINEFGIVVTRNVDSAKWVGRNLSSDPRVARHRAARETSEATRWADNVDRITGSATANLIPWLVSVGLPIDVALANVVSRLIWGATAGMIALLSALGLAWIFSGRIIILLRQLNTDASALAAGDLSHRTAVNSNDEVGALAKTFNTMAAALQVRHQELNAAREAAATEAIERTRLEELERQAKETLAAVIDASPVAIVCSDIGRRIVLWSRAAEQIFGYKSDEVLGRTTKLVPDEAKAESQQLFDRAVRGEAIRDIEVRRRRKDGSIVDVEVAATARYNPDGSVCGVAWAYDDFTERKKTERQLSYLAHYDQLTGLPNRIALKTELAKLIEQPNAAPTTIALFDLDGFKDVNDTLGHSTGDRLLMQVARRLTDVAKSDGKVCRLGGDEFIVIIPQCGDLRKIGELVEGMLKQLSEPFEINDHILHIGGSAGVAIAPNDGSVVDELISNADLALYKAKTDGGRVYRFFMPTLRAQAQMRRALDLELRRAFADGEFELYYQPQIRLATHEIVGAEGLLRWRHPSRGLIAPGAFIDTLAESSIAPEVGRWIIREACAKLAACRAHELALGRISVNLFPRQARDPALPDIVEEALHDHGLPGELLELEITENVALNYDDAIMPLQKVHEKGVKLTFDDFGTGYASLSYLTRFPVSRIKIDRRFVSKIGDDAEDAAIVRCLVAMAHNLGLGITAEGVETQAQAAFLLNEKCEEAQGYLYAKPLSSADFDAYLSGHQLAQPMQGPLPINDQIMAPQAARSGRRRRPRV